MRGKRRAIISMKAAPDAFERVDHGQRDRQLRFGKIVIGCALHAGRPFRQNEQRSPAASVRGGLAGHEFGSARSVR